MFTQTRTNLKIIGTILFAITFLIGGFFINTTKASAEQSFQLGKASSYTMSSYTNSAGGVTTVARVGCDPQTGDKYDINTSKLCSYATSDMRVGCIALSGDKYDINTGKLCAPLVSNVRTGCPLNGIEIYDINTGNRCLIVKNTVNSTPNVSVNSTDNTSGTTTKTTVSPILSEGELVAGIPVTEETTDNGLTASGGKTNSLFAWPMSFPAILLLIIIILIIGYVIYNFIKTNKREPYSTATYGGGKDKKAEVIKPIITSPQARTPNPQVPPLGATPQSKIPDTPLTPSQVNTPNPHTPLTHSQVNTPNPQIPLNIPPNPSPSPQANPQKEPF